MSKKLFNPIQEQGNIIPEAHATEGKKLDTPKEASRKILTIVQNHVTSTNEKLAQQFPTYETMLPQLPSSKAMEEKIDIAMQKPIEELFNTLMSRIDS